MALLDLKQNVTDGRKTWRTEPSELDAILCFRWGKKCFSWGQSKQLFFLTIDKNSLPKKKYKTRPIWIFSWELSRLSSLVLYIHAWLWNSGDKGNNFYLIFTLFHFNLLITSLLTSICFFNWGICAINEECDGRNKFCDGRNNLNQLQNNAG